MARRKKKYGNIRTKTKDGWFDSQGELHRWYFLKDLQKNGHIFKLERQISFSLDVNGQHICRYVADFTYTLPDGTAVVDDFKGMVTETFRLKKKLMKAIHGIDIKVTKKPTEPV